ncbi:MAG: 30S ribosomal protein S20 [Anaerolineae bacterium]|nr:30S ribosomal protein S20 [Anaerolineae bacterium]
MAHHKSAKKRIRSAERKRVHNRQFRARARTHIKQARTLIEGGDVAEARAEVLMAIKTLDKAANKGVIHRNNAARRKSRLMKRLAALEAAS